MNKTVNLALIRRALKNKQLMGFRPAGTTFSFDTHMAADVADAKGAGGSKVGQPKTGQSKIGQGKPGLRKPSQ